MSLSAIFDISSSGMIAESARLTASAGNMSNVNVQASSPDDVYKAKYPVFKSVQDQANKWIGDTVGNGVQLQGMHESKSEPIKSYEPSNPMADANGFVYTANINPMEEMANVISASRSYEMNIEVMNKTIQLMQRTLQLGE